MRTFNVVNTWKCYRMRVVTNLAWNNANRGREGYTLDSQIHSLRQWPNAFVLKPGGHRSFRSSNLRISIRCLKYGAKTGSAWMRLSARSKINRDTKNILCILRAHRRLKKQYVKSVTLRIQTDSSFRKQFKRNCDRKRVLVFFRNKKNPKIYDGGPNNYIYVHNKRYSKLQNLRIFNFLLLT